MSTVKEKVVLKAIEMLEQESDGIRYSILLNKINEYFPETPRGTIKNIIIALDVLSPDLIYKPSRGLFRHVKFREHEINLIKESKNEIDKEKKSISQGEKIKEEDFYKPFSDWLENEPEECTRAIPLGGNKFKDKWGTPDVIGIRESSRSNIITSPTEVISAEIKLDASNLITAFGQACSYKLFSHKSYLVIPKTSSQSDISKLDSLCLISGIGLVLFNPENPQDSQFEIRVRPIKHEPDMFFANKNIKLIEKELFG